MYSLCILRVCDVLALVTALFCHKGTQLYHERSEALDWQPEGRCIAHLCRGVSILLCTLVVPVMMYRREVLTDWWPE